MDMPVHVHVYPGIHFIASKLQVKLVCLFFNSSMIGFLWFSLYCADYITSEDIEVVCVQLEAAWPVLGQALGFSRTELERIAMVSKTHLSAAQSMMEEWKTLYKQNATFFALLGALEIIQRRDIADDLVASRMRGVGISL